MKKPGFLLIFLLVVLHSCAPIINAPYYNTPLEVYKNDPYRNNYEGIVYDTVTAEIGFIDVTDAFGLWLAVVNEDHLLVESMRIKDGKYSEYVNTEIYQISDLKNNPENLTYEEISYSSFYLNKQECVYFKLVPSHLLPETRPNDVSYSDFTISYGEEQIPVTVTYYIGSQDND